MTASQFITVIDYPVISSTSATTSTVVNSTATAIRPREWIYSGDFDCLLDPWDAVKQILFDPLSWSAALESPSVRFSDDKVLLNGANFQWADIDLDEYEFILRTHEARARSHLYKLRQYKKSRQSHTISSLMAAAKELSSIISQQ